MKVSELEGAELDYWVAKAEGYSGPCTAWQRINLGSAGGPAFTKDNHACKHEKCYPAETIKIINGEIGGCPKFSSEWYESGPIIERECITVICIDEDLQPDFPEKWEAIFDTGTASYGTTPLIAAMRAYVSSKFGEEVNKE